MQEKDPMRLRIHVATANEELVALVNEGYDALSAMQADYQHRKENGTYDDTKDVDEIMSPANAWGDKVVESLGRIFPTQLETNLFLNPEMSFGTVSGDYKYASALWWYRYFLSGLNKIRLQSLPEYTDLPLDTRLYVEDIDSFRKVRDVNPAIVMSVLTDGYLDRSEDSVQIALERILSVPFHKKDWGGEINDLYTANVIINGVRHETAFLLKGNGIRSKTMEIKHCGANGDQILRLCNSPAKLFVIQFVGRISEAIVLDIDGKVRQMRSQGRDAWYCIMDGQDTARVLRAYGEL
ncbi:MAG: hypothetical protein E4G89_06120 [Methanothrix sp.]|nr:MAG: hypothetical protein E4G89_06120 [Methanothrix sp.]